MSIKAIFYIFLLFLAFFVTVLFFPYPIPESKTAVSIDSTCVDHYVATEKPNAVVIVAHGLNVKPESMLSLVRLFNQMGSDVILLKLYGHRNGTRMEDVTKDIWLKEMEFAYFKAKELSDVHQIPLYFSGYSLGALIGNYMVFEQNGSYRFDKQILFAPAIAIRNRSKLLRTLFFLGDQYMIGSMTPEEYRANNGTSVAAYKVLFHMEKELWNGQFQGLNIPGLIIMDRKDELVSADKMESLIEKFNLHQHVLRFININDSDKFHGHHHLIIDEHSIGSENWKLVEEFIKKFYIP